ncbi:MAG: hypothetical protein R3F20_03550 [Planctomycetota bacterium]
MRRTLSVAISLLFVFTTAGIGLIDSIWPIEPPAPVGREKQADDKRRAEARITDGSAARLFEDDLRRRSRVHDAIGPYYSFLLYRYFGLTRSSAVAGEDGWFFLRDRLTTVPEAVSENVPLTANLAEALDRRLRGRGIELVVCPVPRKGTVQAESLRRGLAVDDRPYRALIADLRRRGVLVADLLDAFQKHEGEHVYNKVDSHWSDVGMIVAAERTARDGDMLAPPAARRFTLEKKFTKPQPGDILAMIEIDVPEAWVKTFGRDEEVEVWRVEDEGRDVGETKRLGAEAPLAFSGTSFSDGRLFEDFVGHFAGRPVWTSAKRAAGPVAPLEEAVDHVTRQFEDLPEKLVWEIPMHNVFSVSRPLRGMGRVFSDARAGDLAPLSEEFPWIENSTLIPGPLPSKGTSTTRTLGGAFIFPGNGCVSVRLRGRVQNGYAEVRVDGTGRRLHGRWEAGRDQIVMPVVSVDDVSIVNLGLLSRDKASVQIDSIELVTDLEFDAIEATTPELTMNDETWTAAISLVEPFSPEPRDVLLLDLAGRRVARDLEFLIELSEGPPVVVLSADKVDPNARVILPLDEVAGRPILGVLLRADGRKPPALEVDVSRGAPVFH